MEKGQERVKNLNYGFGKRICIGYQFAEIVMKMAFVYWGSAFYYKTGKNFNPEIFTNMTRCVEKANQDVKCKKDFWENIDKF